MSTPTSSAILTAAEMRAAEAASGVPVEMLMDRAGRAVAEVARRMAAGGEVLLMCGPGNNGGDGYVAARVLREGGVAVRVAAAGMPREGAAAAAAQAWGGKVEPLEKAGPAAVTIDALFGTGLSRPLDAAAADALRRTRGRLRVAVDLPSGVSTDDGACLSDVPAADVTIALGALKPAHLLHPAAARCGTLLLADIGIAADSPLTQIGRPRLAPPSAADHKYSRGMVAVVAGHMPGAARLAAEAAAHAGAGYVLLAGPEDLPGSAAIVRRQVSDALLQPVLANRHMGAIVIGPGVGERDGARVAAALATGRPLVLDAGAIAMARGRDLGPAILTPHAGEFAQVFGDLPGSKVEQARAAARFAGAVVLLKGADTVVAAPDGRAAIGHGSSWLSTAGTGDVLAGVCGAMLARGMEPFDAACAAQWLHAAAADAAGPAFVGDALAAELPRLVGRCA